MLTILLHMTVKPGREAECAKMAAELTASTRAEDHLVRLPKAFLALFEHTEVARYDPIV